MPHAYNFLEQLEPEVIQRKHRRKHVIAFCFLGLFFILVLWGLAGIVASGQVLASVIDAGQSAQDAKQQMEDFQFEEAKASLIQAQTALQGTQIGMRVLHTFFPLPLIGTSLKKTEQLLNSGNDLIDALNPLMDLASELTRLSGGSIQNYRDLSSETKQAILERFSTSASDFYLVKSHLSFLQTELEELFPEKLFFLFENPLTGSVEKLVELETSLGTLERAAILLPELAGLDEEHVFLLLFLNNTELRPGGGFIGTYGIARILNGDFTSLQTEDVYALDRLAEGKVNIPTPEPLQDYHATNIWYLRDANWSPDFAVSSLEVIERFISEARLVPTSLKTSIPSPVSLHGVIGFTPTFVSDLLKIVGSITVSGQEFTSENIADAIEYHVEVGYALEGIPESQRKEILADLVEEMKNRLLNLPFSKWGEVLQVIEKGFFSKQLAIYSADQITENYLVQMGWGGRLLAKTPDVLMVVDANLASLKTDPVVERTITSEIFQNTDGDYLGRTRILYTHTGSFNWKTSRYRTYTRLYLPQGTTFLRAQGTLSNDLSKNPMAQEGTVDIDEELGMTVFGAFTSVEPGKQQELLFEYKLGALDHELILQLDFGKGVSYAFPAEEETEWGDGIYHLNTYLDQDKVFQVLF